jgi:hypothetical protein
VKGSGREGDGTGDDVSWGLEKSNGHEYQWNGRGESYADLKGIAR